MKRGAPKANAYLPSALFLAMCLMLTAEVMVEAASPGPVVAWGDNGWGQSTVPVGLISVTAIAAGYGHTVALQSDGTVAAWGDNLSGQITIQADLSGVAAIACGESHTLALKLDGTVVAWGRNNYGQTTVPVGLSGVTAITAGAYHNVALKSNGTMVAWGYNLYGQATIPAGLSNVAQIAAGGFHNVALKNDGTLVAWGWNDFGQTNVPSGLSGVTAIAAGQAHTVTLKGDGTVVAWGRNEYGQTTVPSSLSGVAAIAAGHYHTVAFKSNDTVVAWGWNAYGQTTVPSGLSRVTVIAAGGLHTVVIGYAPPSIRAQPVDQTVTEGQSVNVSLTATGSGLNYQWRKDGTNVPGATNATFTRSSVQFTDAGLYSVIISNELGVVVSSNASLAVVSFGAPVVRADGQIVVRSATREASTELELRTAFPQGHIFYTLDGSAPTVSSPLYSGPITVSNTVVMRALALSSDFSQMAEAPAVTVFLLPYSVEVTSGGAGVAAVSPTQSYYASNSPVTLTATPDSGWSFLRWEGDASGSSNPLGLTVNRSLQVQAIFGTSPLTNVVGSGRIEITPGGPVPYGSTVELRAVPGPGQKFVAWGSAVSGTNNPRLFTVTQPGPAVAALFAAGAAGFPVITSQPTNRVVSAGGSFTLSVSAGGSGPLLYQWRLNGAAIIGETNATLDISGASGPQAGAYDVVVTGPDGTVVSEKASVLVTVFDVRPVVSLLGAAGTGFRVDYTDDLDGGPWLLLTNGVLSAERQEVIDFTSTNRARRFYRTLIPQ